MYHTACVILLRVFAWRSDPPVSPVVSNTYVLPKLADCAAPLSIGQETTAYIYAGLQRGSAAIPPMERDDRCPALLRALPLYVVECTWPQSSYTIIAVEACH